MKWIITIECWRLHQQSIVVERYHRKGSSSTNPSNESRVRMLAHQRANWYQGWGQWLHNKSLDFLCTHITEISKNLQWLPICWSQSLTLDFRYYSRKISPAVYTTRTESLSRCLEWGRPTNQCLRCASTAPSLHLETNQVRWGSGWVNGAVLIIRWLVHACSQKISLVVFNK